MITFSIFETLFSSGVFFLYGIVVAILFNFIFLFPILIKGSADAKSFLVYEIFKFIFYFAVGIYFICLQFAFLDGTPRLYTVLIFLISFAAVRSLTRPLVIKANGYLRIALNWLVLKPIRVCTGFFTKYSKKFQNNLFFRSR